MREVKACGEEILRELQLDLSRLEQLASRPATPGAVLPLAMPIRRIRARLDALQRDIRRREDLYREDRYLLAAAMDGVSGIALRILRRARRELSPVEARPFPLTELSRELGVGEGTISKNVYRLVRLGYLARATTGPFHSGNPYEYLLSSPAARAA